MMKRRCDAAIKAIQDHPMSATADLFNRISDKLEKAIEIASESPERAWAIIGQVKENAAYAEGSYRQVAIDEVDRKFAGKKTGDTA